MIEMLEEINKRDKAHLINLIGRRSNKTPNFALLIGAGASATSGVKIASQMIAEWRRQLYEQSQSNEPFEGWLQKQEWHGDEEEYSILFEKVCDQRSQRRIYIEECVKDAKPSWGHIYLANIIAHNYFNVIFTPNFDDLLNEACFIYADLRPIVCAHDSAVADIRVTSARPKIIKLHGDFLYDSIKNTVRETETLEQNMRDKFIQFAREYGLIVIGYGGNDRSIMDILDMLLSSEGYFPNGLYWCTQNGDKVTKKLKRLMQRENTYLVEIDGFDEFMAELHEGLKLTLPETIRDAFKATTEKLNTFILPGDKIRHPIIKKDIAELEKQVEKFKQVISGKATKEEIDELVPYIFLGVTSYLAKDYKNALVYLNTALIQNPNELLTMKLISEIHVSEENFEDALDISEKMIKQKPTDSMGYWVKGNSLTYLNRFDDAIASFNEALKRVKKGTISEYYVHTDKSNVLLIASNWKEALLDAEKALQINAEGPTATINKCIALKKLGMEKYEKILRDFLPKLKNNYYRASVFAVLGDKNNMIKELEAAIKENIANRVDAKHDPDFVDYREDSDFRKLVYEGKE